MQSCKCIPMTIWWKDKRETQVEEKLSDLIENMALNFLCSVLCEGLHVFILSPNEQQMMLLTLTFPNWKWVCGRTTPVAGAGECCVLALPALVPISLVGTRGESLKIKPKHFLTFNIESHNSYMCAHVHMCTWASQTKCILNLHSTKPRSNLAFPIPFLYRGKSNPFQLCIYTGLCSFFYHLHQQWLQDCSFAQTLHSVTLAPICLLQCQETSVWQWVHLRGSGVFCEPLTFTLSIVYKIIL